MSNQDWNVDGHFAALENYFRCVKAMTPEQLREVEGDEGFEYPEEVALRTVALALREKVMVPSWAAEAFLSALARYDQFEVANLGEAFACPTHTHLTAKRRHNRMAEIYYALEMERQRRLTIDEGLRGDESAEETVGKRFHLSASSVRDKHRAWREQCDRLGIKPDEPICSAGDVSKIFKALAAGLAPKRSGEVQ